LVKPPHNTTIGSEERTRAGIDLGDGGNIELHRTHSEETLKINEEEYNWGLDFVRAGEKASPAR
jgi:hypothetical protein